MNGSSPKAVIDTNIIFMAWYNPLGKCADVLRYAREGRAELFSPDSVREEIIRVFRKNNFSEEEIEDFVADLPVRWVDKEIYMKVINKTAVKHRADKPIEAVSIILNYGILSANKHFKNRLDINKLLEMIRK